jgi:hypothetical protein
VMECQQEENTPLNDDCLENKGWEWHPGGCACLVTADQPGLPRTPPHTSPPDAQQDTGFARTWGVHSKAGATIKAKLWQELNASRSQHSSNHITFRI